MQVGDRVALMCGNRVEFLEVFLGAGWMALWSPGKYHYFYG